MGCFLVLVLRSQVMESVRTIGDLLREWRQRRRLSQLDLACEAEISTRHLSFLETGRSLPSREMVLHLAEQLEVPKRERNVLLVAAGYAPMFPERALQDPVLEGARKAIDLVLEAQKPYPAFALDRHWMIAASNRALPELYGDVAPELLQPPINALRLGLHPEGLAPKIANLPEWRAHLLARLRRQIDLTGDPVLMELLQEISKYPGGVSKVPALSGAMQHAVVVPLQIQTGPDLLSFFSTTTIFGSPVDVTLSELALECFYPADEATAEAVRAMTPTPSAAATRADSFKRAAS
jgi:transcriptional regulator with XRE-family HTH domain